MLLNIKTEKEMGIENLLTKINFLLTSVNIRLPKYYFSFFAEKKMKYSYMLI